MEKSVAIGRQPSPKKQKLMKKKKKKKKKKKSKAELKDRKMKRRGAKVSYVHVGARVPEFIWEWLELSILRKIPGGRRGRGWADIVSACRKQTSVSRGNSLGYNDNTELL
jgi:hypothetical protein